MYIKWGWLRFFILSAFILIAGCSGGGGDDGGGVDGSGYADFSGTAAEGSALANAIIRSKSLKGDKEEGTTNDNGKFRIRYLDNPGVVLLKAERNNAPGLFSIASTEGKTGNIEKTVNIHPFTDLIVRNWFAVQGLNIEAEFNSNDPIAMLPTVQDIENIKATINGLINLALINYSLPADFDLVSSEFDANNLGFDAFLDDSFVSIINNLINISVIDR